MILAKIFKIRRLLRKAATFAAQGFGLGWSPVAPGTVGSLWGVAIVWAFTAAELSVKWQVVACLAMTALSIPLAGIAEKELGEKDPGNVVCDEFLTFPISMIGLTEQWQNTWWLLPVAFIVTRVLDITKPFPAWRSQKLPGGIGITVDDAIVSIYALGINWALFSLFG